MSKTGLKSVLSEVSIECWQELKIVAIRKNVTLPIVIREILERAMSKKIISSKENKEEI